MGRTIGVLALQGDFSLHQQCLEKIEVPSIRVRKPEDLEECDGLIVPGGESTTFVKLLKETGLFEAIRTFAKTHPIMGTCAGLIALATSIQNDPMDTLGLIDVTVERNAYGRQIHSFVQNVFIPIFPKNQEFEGVFIRAPRILKLGKNTEAIGFLGEEPVMVKNERILALTFHPELTQDTRIHRYFLESFVLQRK